MNSIVVQPSSTRPTAAGRGSRPPSRVLIALGGNAIDAVDASPGVDPTQATLAAVRCAMSQVAMLVAAGAQVILTHGNGPQVGDQVFRSRLAAGVISSLPLDWCGAQTQGVLGYLLVNALETALMDAGIHSPVVALVTRVLVDSDDPALRNPTKPIGPLLERATAERLGLTGDSWQEHGERRRLRVTSPEPKEILEAAAIKALMEAGYVVIAAGGGGIPVTENAAGRREGLAAVVDKDLAAALLARQLDPDLLLIATDVRAACLGFGTADETPIGATTPGDLRRLLERGEFGAGSMAPKVLAAIRFAEAGGRAVITSLDRIVDGAAGRTGTVVQNAYEI